MTAMMAYLACGEQKTGFVRGEEIEPELVELAKKNFSSYLESLPSNTAVQRMKGTVIFEHANALLPTLDDTLYDKIYFGASLPAKYRDDFCLRLRPGGIIVGPVICTDDPALASLMPEPNPETGKRPQSVFLKGVKSQSGTMQWSKLMSVIFIEMVIPTEEEKKNKAIQLKEVRANKKAGAPSGSGGVPSQTSASSSSKRV